EMCMMMADTMDALGLAGKYVVKVNNRKVLDGAMEAVGLSGEENAERKLQAMRAIDKLDRLGEAGVSDLLQNGRKDESGAFTPGVGLDVNAAAALLDIFARGGQVIAIGNCPLPFTDDDARET